MSELCGDMEAQLAFNVEAVERGVPRAAAITVRFHCSCSNASSVTTWGAIRALVPALHVALVLTKFFTYPASPTCTTQSSLLDES